MKPVFDENGLAITPGELRCFYFSHITGEYSGWSDEYINIGVSMPSNSTDLDPGEPTEGHVYVFTGEGWSLEEDHRGETVYYIDTGEPLLITEIGPYPDGTSITKPPEPEPTNEEKRKSALTNLSNQYQADISKLNIAWLAAAVSDGVSEGTKKDAVIAQIDARKAQYASDRAAIIAQYP
ncbi:tail fiber assembly protein [Citrobacter farmeri]|uniref:tail fiber assembly protein n=1 Tax=Citrobacter farmeri TaxID=67824 RepID=UPI002A83A49E|nr:tail fiber assembly protein [Citrobacter farmeri]